MIKYLFIVINSLSLFFLSLFSGGSVSVTSNIPATMVVGQEVTIELKLAKPGIEGFSRLQLELPEGLSIKDAESKDADYSYSAGVAKWAWAAPPSGDEVAIKVTLEANGNAGTKTIQAKFSYVENNVKQVVEMTPVEVSIKADASKPGAMTMATTNSEPPGNIAVERLITKVSDSEYLVTLKIKKGLTKGFAKYSDDITDNLTVKAVKTDGSSFSLSDGKLKFVWVNVPEKEELEISYTVSGNLSAGVDLNGEYSYLEANQSKKYKLDPEKIPASAAPAPSQEKPVTNLPEETQKEAPKETVAAAETKTETQAPAETNTEAKTETKSEEPAERLSTDVSKTGPDAVTERKDGAARFAVQIGAFLKTSSAERLKKQFRISEPVNSEMQDGMSKYTVGSHQIYKNARTHKDLMRDMKGVKGAFVVAYSGAKRITVQEALMMTNQKWFK